MTGVVIGVSVCGVLGALLATPVIATGREVLHYINRKMKAQEPIQAEDPAPESGTPPTKNWLSSLLAGLQRLVRSRSRKSRQGSGEE